MTTGHGGAREGAGRIAPDALGPCKPRNTSLDEQTVATMKHWGEGDLSRGIRRAARYAEELTKGQQAKGKKK